MKKVFFLFVFLGMARIAFGDWFVINSENEIVAKCDYQPSEEDLESRNERVVYSKDDIPLHEARVDGDKVVRRVMTQKDLEEQQKQKDKYDEEELIQARLRKIAIEQMKSEGMEFKYADKNEDSR